MNDQCGQSLKVEVQLLAGPRYFYDAQRDDMDERFYHTTILASNLIISSILSVQSLGKIRSLSFISFYDPPRRTPYLCASMAGLLCSKPEGN